jgi:hypothetical protein
MAAQYLVAADIVQLDRSTLALAIPADIRHTDDIKK